MIKLIQILFVRYILMDMTTRTENYKNQSIIKKPNTKKSKVN